MSLTGGLDRHTHGRTKISLSVPRSCRYYSYLLYWIYRRTDGQRYLYLEVASRLENNSQVTPLKNLSNLGPVSSRIASFQVWMNPPPSPPPPPNSASYLSPCPPTVPPPCFPIFQFRERLTVRDRVAASDTTTRKPWLRHPQIRKYIERSDLYIYFVRMSAV